MMSSRVARGAGVLKQGLRHNRGSHSPFTGGASTFSRSSSSSATAYVATATLRVVSSVIVSILTSGVILCSPLCSVIAASTGPRQKPFTRSSCAAFFHQNNGYRGHGVRHQLPAAMPSPLGNPSAAVGGCRYLSGRPGGPTDEKREGAKQDGAKAPYRFIEQGGGESKGDLETDSATMKTQDAKKEEVEPAKNSMWMRVKRASSKMKLLWKQYGLVAIGTYTVLYVAGFGGVYLVLVTGLVEPDVDTAAWIQKGADLIGAGQNEWVMWIERTVRTNPNAEKVATAFIVNELLEYPREFIVIAATPSIARALGRAPAKVTTEEK